MSFSKWIYKMSSISQIICHIESRADFEEYLDFWKLGNISSVKYLFVLISISKFQEIVSGIGLVVMTLTLTGILLKVVIADTY